MSINTPELEGYSVLDRILITVITNNNINQTIRISQEDYDQLLLEVGDMVNTDGTEGIDLMTLKGPVRVVAS
jgi:hypothetical protein